ncbi:MAG: hypothetical protein KatS3mg009_0406 [Acidimicrobiia bacterium]|nr:MAG: hypothetical protein KatS3mg009_0406 [Acidimicrobiia bacterium]
MSRNLPAPLAAVVLAVAVAACGGGGDAPRPAALHGLVPVEPMRVGGYSLPEVTVAPARDFVFRAPEGGLLAVFFGFKHCPDICPTTMADLSRALELLGPPRSERVAVAMATVDPERDDAAVLDRFLRRFFPDGRYHGLRTDDEGTLRRVQRAFGVASQRTLRPDGTTDFGHSSVVVVVDDHGDVRVLWPFGVSSRDMAEDLRVLLAGA